MDERYIKYGAIALGVILVLYLMSRSSGGSTSDGAVAVDVNYNPSGDQGAAIAARAQAFSELVGLGSQSLAESSALEQARMTNETARQISDDEAAISRYEAGLAAALGKYELDTSRAIEEMRIRGARELMEYQADQVNLLAQSFRGKSVDRQSTILNALTSIWGTSPTYVPERRNRAAEIINSVGNALRGVSGFFGVGGA